MPQLALTPEQEATLTTLATEGYNHWKANATPEIKAAGDAEMQKFMTDPAVGAAEMARVAADFTECDADGNGRLNKAEYTAFLEKQFENGR